MLNFCIKQKFINYYNYLVSMITPREYLVISLASFYLLTGCSVRGPFIGPSPERISRVEERVSKLEKTVEKILAEPIAEGAKILTQKEYPTEFGRLLEVILGQYKDAKSKQTAENADAIIITPTDKGEYYIVVPIKDIDKDELYTPRVDKRMPDKVLVDNILRYVLEFKIETSKIPEPVRNLFPNLRSAYQE